MATGAEKKRLELLAAYPSEKWKARVKEMPEDQIVAIHMRLRSQRKV